MSKLLKVREVITLKGWAKGSGWSYSQVDMDEIVDVVDTDEPDWDWYDPDTDTPLRESEDTQIIVEYFAVDADIIRDRPLKRYEKWASEIYAERRNY